MDISKEKPSVVSQQVPLHFITCGNVDDGKSTLIGRLLWDTKSVKDDHAKELTSKNIQLLDGATHPDFANLLDGLQAEREQGITIDVAYRYFSSSKRSFIVADTPGHEQYTRNMVTGASTAELAVLLVDAQTGVTTQTKRHALLASLMGIKSLILVVNKMDLIQYDKDRYEAIAESFEYLRTWIDVEHLTTIPIAAVHGHNVVHKADKIMAWYRGPTLLEALETVPTQPLVKPKFRLNVQRVSRPNEHFRGFQGTVQGDVLKRGDKVTVQRSAHSANVKEILTFDGAVNRAEAGDAVTLVLDRKIDIARGDTFSHSHQLLQSATKVAAKLIILDDQGITPAKRYWLKIGAHKQRVIIQTDEVVDLKTGRWEKSDDVSVNTISRANLSFDSPIFFDPYVENPDMGAFIIIDPDDYRTVAGGMIENALEEEAVEELGTMVHITLPSDFAIDLLAQASNSNRLDELTVRMSDESDIDSEWIRTLQAKGLHFIAHNSAS